MRSLLRCLSWAFVGSAFLASPMLAWAGWDTPTVTKLPSGAFQVSPSVRTMLRDAFAASALEAQAASRTLTVGANLTVPVGQKSATMLVGWKLTESAAGKVLARSIPVIGTASLAYAVAKEIRCYAAPGSTGWAGLLECDGGTTQVSVSGFTSTLYPSECSGSTRAAVYQCERMKQKALWAASNPTYFWFDLDITFPGVPSPAASEDSVGSHWVGCAKATSSPPSTYSNCTLRTTGSSLPTVSSSMQCPSSIDLVDGSRSLPAGLPPGPDGKCATARGASTNAWVPASENDVAAKLPLLSPTAENLPEIAREAISQGGAAAEDAIRELGTPSLSGPATVNGPTSTTTPPGGSPVTTTTVYNMTYLGDTYSYTTTTINGDGSQTTGDPVVPKVDVETCGLPGKPACKIDETGTPTAGNLSSAESALATAQGVRVGEVGEASHNRGSLGWSFSLGLPVGTCVPFEYVSRIGTLTANPCTSSGVALWRALLAWACGAMAALYCWRSVTSLSV